MAASANSKGGVVTFTIKVAGNAIADKIRVHDITVEKNVNTIATAKIVILDGEADTGDFAISSSDVFVPGAAVTIEAGYDTKNEVIFSGIITKQSLRIDDYIGSALEVECRDLAIKMIIGRKSLTFSQKTDSDIISSIIGNYPGLTPAVTATTTVWPEQVQYYVTDWDFILARAEINGLIVTTLNGKVSVCKPAANPSPVMAVKFGDGLMEFNADLNSINQLGSVNASTWDFKNQAISAQAASNNVPGPGNISSKKLAEVVGLSAYQLQTTAPLENADLTNWSNAQLIKSEYSKIQGMAKFQGTSVVDPAKYITLQGLGDRFNGDHLISGVVHTIKDGNWLTAVSLGLSMLWFVEEPDVMSPPASGLLPAARGLFNGTVKQMYEDPDSQFRILVDVPMFDQNGAGIWARISNFYSTSNAGIFFLPEVGDEVILGFLNEDPRYPIILGSMYSNSKLQPYKDFSPIQNNSLKAIVSKSGIYIKFDDENKIFTITTPDNNTLILDDKAKKITLSDDNKNMITMSADGITIKSPKDINIEADQNILLKGTQGIKVQASGGDVEVTAVNIKETADSQYSAEGSEMAKINSGAELILKSAMIMIN